MLSTTGPQIKAAFSEYFPLQYSQYLVLHKLHHAIHHEPDIVKSHWLYTQFEAASQNNASAGMAEQEDTTTKEPRPNNLEEAKE